MKLAEPMQFKDLRCFTYGKEFGTFVIAQHRLLDPEYCQWCRQRVRVCQICQNEFPVES